MLKIDFEEAVENIVERDRRFRRGGYFFLRAGLDYTIRELDKPLTGPGRHVSGKQLLDGLRRYALEEFGPMAATVLDYWGIRRTEDFGEMVFCLVEEGVLGKTERDDIGDFAAGYDFYETFRAPYLPRGSATSRNDKRSSEEDC